MRRYLFNYFVWWYVINGKSVYLGLISNWRYTLEALNIIPMITNLFMPLFQDYSLEGKLVAVPFRIFWVLFGSLFQLVYSVCLAVIYGVYLIFPFIPLGIIAFNIVK